MKQRDELIIICIAAVAVTAIVAAAVFVPGDSEQTEKTGPSVSWTVKDLGNAVSMYSPAYETDASDAYGYVSGYATDYESTYHWYRYTVTWSADPGTAVYPGMFRLTCIDRMTDPMGTAHVFSPDYGYWDLGFFVPETDSKLPSQAAVPQSGVLTLDVVLPVHVGTHPSAYYDDDGWTCLH